MKAVKEDIRKWAAEKQKKRLIEKKKLQSILDLNDDRIDKGIATNEEIEERNQAAIDLRRHLKKESEDINKKFKNKWCLEGDENSALYHKKINKKKHTSSIKGITLKEYGLLIRNTLKEAFSTTSNSDSLRRAPMIGLRTSVVST